MSYEDFIDLKKIALQIGPNYNKTLSNENIKTGHIKVIKVQKTDPDILFVKTSYEQEEYLQIKVNNISTRQRNSSKIECLPAYTNKLDISDKKKTDIQALIMANQIPKLYKPIYDSMFM